MTLRWMTPVGHGGSPITHYLVTPYIGATGSAPRNIDRDLGSACRQRPGEREDCYRFRVAAVNASGAGPWSVASRPVTVRAAARHRNG